ncbi:MAG: protein jag [Lachnospiraceae bacterium]
MEYKEFTGKTVDDAVMEAAIQLETTSDKLDYKVLDKGSSGFLGIGSRPAKISARRILDTRGKIEEFLAQVFGAMQIKVNINIEEDMENRTINIDLSGEDMGVLIGKRGQTLDSLQYLVSLVINKDEEEYIRVKMDTENYRQRRKDTLENLAKNIAFKVKRTGKPVTLEPMNPYERRVIHSALQNDRYVETHSEGEEPFRRVVVTLKEGVRIRDNNNRHRRFNNNRSSNRNYNKKGGGRE